MIIDVCHGDKAKRFSTLEPALIYAGSLNIEFSIWIYGALFLTYTEDLKTGDYVTVLY